MQQKTIFLIVFCSFFTLGIPQTPLPQGFTEVKKLIPDLEIDLRYATSNNFIGQKIEGYLVQKAILSTAAATALVGVQNALQPLGLGLKLFDGYRPQRAVNQFVHWVNTPHDTLMKAQFYPQIPKSELFKQQYIASRSGHSRGSTVDITIIDFNTCQELDMGGLFDFFGDVSNLNYNHLTKTQKKNRALLQHLMTQHGFRSYAQEWWHFTLNNEPFPTTYFNFIIE